MNYIFQAIRIAVCFGFLDLPTLSTLRPRKGKKPNKSINKHAEMLSDYITQQSTSGYISKRTENNFSKMYLYTHVHSNTINNSHKVEGSKPNAHQQTNVMELLFSLKKEILTHAITCMNQDMLSEISQSQKDNSNTV